MRSLSLALLVLGPLLVRSQIPRVLTPEVDQFIEGILSRWGSPGGVSVAVVRLNANGEWNVETKGYGTARLDDNSNVTDETLFSIGSNSKLFTVAATGLLIANETLTPRFSWNTKITSLIPSWELVDPIATNKSSIKDLMSHRTGMPRHEFSYRKADTLLAMIDKLKFLKPSTEFREIFQYNNLMYNTLGYLPEVLSTQTPLARYVKKNIFDPLGMNSTTYSFDVANATGKLSPGFARENFSLADGLPGTGVPRQLPYWYDKGGEDGNFLAGAGGVISNAKDMATWLQALILWGKNPATNETVIPSEVLEMAASGITVDTTGIPLPPEAQALLSQAVYGGGQSSSTYRGHRAHSWVARLPFDNIGVAVLTNDDDTGVVFDRVIQYRLMDEALGLEPFDWETPASEILAQVSGSTPTPRPGNSSSPSIPGGFASIEGTYNNPGYGNWSFCLFEPGNQPSEACKSFATNLSAILPGGIDPEVPTLVAPVNSIWFDYVQLQHFDGNVFNVTFLSSYPTVNDPNQPFWTSFIRAPYQAEVGSLDDTVGLGFSGGFWGAGAGAPEPRGTTLEERSEVWFEKIESSFDMNATHSVILSESSTDASTY
ncbi:hypothetical protein PM082_017972 [Marasmius tenuissimus]|nr:hypothetical protein PM082_017972 [Marasmius tenuissimus]